MDKRFWLYVLKRFLLGILTIFVVATITFWVMQLVPGGPFLSEKATPQYVLDELNALYGLDKPVFIQYLNYLKGIVVFNFGFSLKQRGRTVMDIILSGLKVSAPIGLIAMVLALFFGVIFGSWAALRQNKFADRMIMLFTTTCVAMPSFVIATMLLLIFCVLLPWFPANGQSAAGYILPTLTLSLLPMANITRFVRTTTVETLKQDFIVTATAKGLPRRTVLFKHGLRNSITPVITYAGPMFAFIITGSLVVEQVFTISGLGSSFVNSITSRDYPLIMGTTVFITELMVVVLFISDLLYSWVDPRVKFE